jgi:hypothetical protein
MSNHKIRIHRLERIVPKHPAPVYDPAVLSKYLSNAELAVLEEGFQIIEAAEQAYYADQPLKDDHWITPHSKALFLYMSDEDLEVLERAAELLERADREYQEEVP